MRTFVVLLIAGVLGCLFIVQKRHDQTAAPAPVATTTTTAQKAATPRPVSEHNWAKHAIDRARNVSDQVATQRKEDGARK